MTALDQEQPMAQEDHEAARVAAELRGWRHRHAQHEIVDRWEGTPFGRGERRRAYNVVTGTAEGRELTAFDYLFWTLSDPSNDELDRSTRHHFLVCVLELKVPMPGLQATANEWHDAVAAQVEDGALEVGPPFSGAYLLQGSNRSFGQAVLTPPVVGALLDRQQPNEWRFRGSELIGWARNQKCGQELSSFVDALSTLAAAAEAYQSDRAEPAPAP